jgi:hypothetical protein
VRFFEEYKSCGCVSGQSAKSELPGYCATHGNEPSHVYRTDGFCVWDWRTCDPVDLPSNRAAAQKERG